MQLDLLSSEPVEAIAESNVCTKFEENIRVPINNSAQIHIEVASSSPGVDPIIIFFTNYTTYRALLT